MEVLREKVVKTRKARVCSSCLRKYEPGSEMMCTVLVDDGIFSWYNCLTCHELMKRYAEDYMDDGFEEGWVHDHLEEGQLPEELLDQLNPMK